MLSKVTTRHNWHKRCTYYNDSETLSHGYSLKLERNDDGVLQLKHFNEKNELIEKDTINFTSEREADYYLRRRA